MLGAPAQAETPAAVVMELDVDGVFIARSRSAEHDEQAMRQSIERARAMGLRVVVAAPVDPQPSPLAFARRILEASDADVALVYPPEGGLETFVIDDFESAQFRALAAARSKSGDAAAIDAFVEELVAEPAQPVPEIVRRLVLIMMALAIILAVLVVLESLLRPRRRRARIKRQAAEATVRQTQFQSQSPAEAPRASV